MTLETPRRLIWLLALTYGLTIANIYYCQPLLPEITGSYGPATPALTTLNQVGYALALVLIVPLGDIVRRRPLVCLLLCVDAMALILTAIAPTVGVLLAAGVVVGLASAGVVNILVAYAATVAADHERGRAVGTMLTGGLTGVLLSRTVAGLVSQAVGWRVLFLAAAAVTLVLAATLARTMAPADPEVSIGYLAQLRATVRLAATEPVLRAAVRDRCLRFRFFRSVLGDRRVPARRPPYHFSAAAIGLVALVGGAGVLAARLTGRAADRGWQRPMTGLLLVLGAVSFAVLWLGGQHLTWFFVGLLAVDIAIHGTHLLNLSVVYGLTSAARSRIASVYMTAYTLGGVIGTAAGVAAYELAGWGAVCVVGRGCA
ncbi:MFS transporter [Fodinicola feengrottensis]|uniref:MFS transporter n=1 Tax=Fodinicola feengrottensis TaxID=435914 RepID=UPI0013D26A13|nr:MFS transporter [Fodinicola feengrottensis]